MSAVPWDHLHDEPLPDIEVGRYALRTFWLGHGSLRSLYQDFYWDQGTAIAECRSDSWSPPHPDQEVPAHKCGCGLYGTLTIEQLLREYGSYAKDTVAVIAAEGSTYIGTKGLRTAAARVVAFWHPDEGPYSDLANKAYKDIDAVRYGTVAEMISAYNFPTPEIDPDEHIKEIAAVTLMSWGGSTVTLTAGAGGGGGGRWSTSTISNITGMIIANIIQQTDDQILNGPRGADATAEALDEYQPLGDAEDIE